MSNISFFMCFDVRVVVGLDFGIMFLGFGYVYKFELEGVCVFYEWLRFVEVSGKLYCKI